MVPFGEISVPSVEAVVEVETASGRSVVAAPSSGRSVADVAVSSAVANDAAFVDEAAVEEALVDCVCSRPSIDWMACIWFTTSA